MFTWTRDSFEAGREEMLQETVWGAERASLRSSSAAHQRGAFPPADVKPPCRPSSTSFATNSLFPAGAVLRGHNTDAPSQTHSHVHGSANSSGKARGSTGGAFAYAASPTSPRAGHPRQRHGPAAEHASAALRFDSPPPALSGDLVRTAAPYNAGVGAEGSCSNVCVRSCVRACTGSKQVRSRSQFRTKTARR